MNAFTFPAAVLAQNIAVLGKNGSGKTSTAKLIIEQVVPEGARVCILDPIKSDWWGLTLKADGRRAGLPFQILGGPRGHVPLNSSAGKAIAELVAAGSLRLSIIDMADFEPGGIARFFVDFAPELLRRMRGVIYLVMEEAHLFAPKERSGIGVETMAIHWAKTIATAGRSRGIRVIVVTQRIQALHNALLGSCESLIAHRVTAPADQEPVLKWLKANTVKEVASDVAANLAALRTGSGWIVSGEATLSQRVDFPRIKTYDNTVTPSDDDPRHDVKVPPVDTDALRAIIGEAVAQAEANDPEKLKARIAELERQVKTQPKPGLSDQSIKELIESSEERGRQLGKVAGTRAFVEDIGPKLLGPLERLLDSMRGLVASASHPDSYYVFPPRPEPAATATPPLQSPTKPAPTRASASAAPARLNGTPSAKGRGAELRILRVLASRAPVPLTERQWATLSVMKHTTGTWRTYLSRLRTAGFIESASGQFGTTPAGLDAAGALGPRMNTVVLWRQALGAEVKLFEILIDSYPEAVTKEELAERCLIKHTTGTFRTYMSRLNSNGLVEIEGDRVKLSPDIFL